MQVDAVQQRAGDPPPVLGDGAGGAGAFPGGVPQVAAFAGVHGRYQHEFAGVGGCPVYAAHGNGAVLQRLAQHLQRIAGKFRQFIQKQHAVVGKAHLAGAGERTAAHDGGGADTVVRAAERPRPDQPLAAAQQPGNRVDGAGLQRFFVGQRRQDTGQPLGQHALAGARRPHQQQIVPACGGDLQRAARLALAAHIGHVGPQPDAVFVIPIGLGGRQRFRAAQMQHHVLGAAGGVDGQPRRHGGFGGVFRRQEQFLHALLHGGQRHGKHAGHGAQRAVQPQFPQKSALRAGGGQLALGGQDADEYGQVIHRAGLAYVGRGQVDGDAAGRPLVMQVFHRAAHPLAALFHSGIRQPHQVELRQPAGKIRLHLYQIPGQPRDAQARHLCKHVPSSHFVRLSATSIPRVRQFHKRFSGKTGNSDQNLIDRARASWYI